MNDTERIALLELRLAQFMQYAAYCNCCAKSGEHDPIDFDTFVAQNSWPTSRPAERDAAGE